MPEAITPNFIGVFVESIVLLMLGEIRLGVISNSKVKSQKLKVKSQKLKVKKIKPIAGNAYGF
ncbi:MAG: hypothetical protein QNJ47_03500 [Nostocaceae cyanobacterium]|nr:hypothetical protein [Nostocaceae cyanobacterium]